MAHRKTYQDMSEINEWIEHSYYLVEAAFSNTNPLHRYVFFTGFITGGMPSGYNSFCKNRLTYKDAVYIKPIKLLYTEENYNIVDPITLAEERMNGCNS